MDASACSGSGSGSESDYDEPAYTSDEQQPAEHTPLPELRQDPEGFLRFLDHHADRSKSWQDQLQALAAHDQFDLVDPTARAELFQQWSTPREPVGGSYLDLVKQKWQPGLFYLQFKRMHRADAAFGDPTYTEKQRETIYREYARLAKKAPGERPSGGGECTEIALAMLS